MRLATTVNNETRLRLKPFGAFYAVVSSQAGKILSCLGILVFLQMSWRQNIRLDLVDIPETNVSLSHNSCRVPEDRQTDS